jgi:hypothetical protein
MILFLFLLTKLDLLLTYCRKIFCKLAVLAKQHDHNIRLKQKTKQRGHNRRQAAAEYISTSHA